jgi:hypothetical protein
MERHFHHARVCLSNFTVFREASLEFVPGVNVLVGENGTGKTHLMKALYAFQMASRSPAPLISILLGVFQTREIEHLISSNTRAPASVQGLSGGVKWGFTIEGGERPVVGTRNQPLTEAPRPVFIPALDMLGHTRRFLSTYDELQIDFDQTHRDIVALLLSPERRDGNGSLGPLLDPLEAVLGGTVEEEGERFYLRTPSGRQAMPLVAEGIRRIAALHQLIANGWLQPGTVLFWDEPEVNLNPTLMDEVVGALLELARLGVQVFVATHSFVILKELDLQSGPKDLVRYFALAPDDAGTRVTMSDDYSSLEPNPIAAQFDRLWDLELMRSTQPK